MNDETLFILAGYGNYLNRGCEAIIRGTVHILRRHFSDPSFLVLSSFHNEQVLQQQRAGEYDPAIQHERTWGSQQRFDGPWFITNILRRTFPRLLRHFFYGNLNPYLDKVPAVLAVGGDNYSIDYDSRPFRWTVLDDLVVSRGKPLIVWGASVGPFTRQPHYERYMSRHLRKVHIFSRESLTTKYLNSLGLTANVYQVADPAFLMDPVAPAEQFVGSLPLENGAIGMNLSPLLSKYITAGNIDAWASEAAQIVQAVLERTGRAVCLIPHVTDANPRRCDYSFLRKVASLLKQPEDRLVMLPNNLSAAETKWVISKMSFFAGARTHATIAAISSCIPTLSFGYSVKSRGINQDVYGHTHYCMDAKDMSAQRVAAKIEEMMQDADRISSQLNDRVPALKNAALVAGQHLKIILADQARLTGSV